MYICGHIVRKELRMKRAIVTGCTGNIGISLIRELKANGYEVFAVARPGGARNARLRVLCPGCHVIECGLDELERLPELMKSSGFRPEADEFYHIGWNSDFDNPRYNLEGQLLNKTYTENALRIAAYMGCGKFTGVGSQAECGLVDSPINSKTPDNPITAYAVAKCETYKSCCELSGKLGMDFYWPRLLSEYGPYDSGTLLMLCIDACLNHKELNMTGAEQIWDYVYADDVARALYLIMQKGIPMKKYAIASGIGKPLKEYTQIVSEVFSYPELMNGLGKRAYIEKEVMYLVGDVSELKADVGMVFDTDFRKHMEYIKYIQ